MDLRLPHFAEVMKSQVPKKPKAPANGRAKPKKPVDVPPILLEGDTSSPPSASGPGQRYATPGRTEAAKPATTAELPEAYGTKKLVLRLPSGRELHIVGRGR